MEIDLDKYLPTFIEESLELIQVMEDVLLELDINAIDVEKINQIFRSVHTLKSSSAAFNLLEISEFAHTIENFLNPIRRAEQEISQYQCELLLKSVDCLRGMILSVKERKEIDSTCAVKLGESFVNSKLGNPEAEIMPQVNEKTEADKVDKAAEVTPQLKINNWKISFNPKATLFSDGNDPLRIFTALADLGDFKVNVNIHELPNFANFDPEKCYLSWEIFLQGNITIEKIEEILNWIVTKDEYAISAVNEPQEEISVSPIVQPQTIQSKPESDVKPAEAAPLVTTVRINTDKLDELINLIGELVITQSMLNQVTKDFSMEKVAQLKEGLILLEHNCRELQEEAMQIRMLPISTVLNRFPRMVHELSKKLGKQTNLIVTGEQTELDRSVIEKIIDPLGHIIRNTIDHGIEPPEVRLAVGKPAAGTITIDTYQSGGSIIITVKDDGAGFNLAAIEAKAHSLGLLPENEKLTPEKISWIIVQPGFSTAAQITEISGRGVGMDVVNKNIQQLGGSLEISSVAGMGATISLRLPLTLLIMDCQLIQIKSEVYIIPLISMTEILKIEPENISFIDSQTSLYHLRSSYIPIIYLANTLGISAKQEDLVNKFLVVVDINKNLYGLVCDNVLSQQQIVIKSLEENFYKVPGISGATILGDGSVALIIDIHGVIDLFHHVNNQPMTAMGGPSTSLRINATMKQSSIIDKLASNQILQFIGFFISNKEYAVNILCVNEILVNERITILPNVPDYIMGVMNLRGVIIPVVDFSRLLNLGDLALPVNRAILVVTVLKGNQKKVIGIVVDAVSDTYNVKAEDINPLPEQPEVEVAKYISGLIKGKNQMIILLDIENIFPFFE